MEKIVLEITGSDEEASWVNYYGFLAENKETVSVAIMEALDAILAPRIARGMEYVPYDQSPKFLEVLGVKIQAYKDMIFYGHVYKDHVRTDKQALQYEEPRLYTLDEWFESLNGD